MLLVYLAAGGAAGTLARYGLGSWIQSWAGTAFPWGTLAINVTGSFLLGLFIRLTEGMVISADLRQLLTVGFCGAFTTFSTFSYEVVVLIQAGEMGRAAGYAAVSLSLGIAALSAGLLLATSSLSLAR